MKRKDSIFTKVPVNRVNRNYFDLSHEVKMSGKFGVLYPMLCLDCLPGDVIRDQLTVFMRAAPMVAPIMHRCDVTTHFFFVPNRLIFDGWEKFITGGQDGEEATVLPWISPNAYMSIDVNLAKMKKGTLWDYLGLPVLEGAAPAVASTEHISALPFKAYQKVWNDYYRDPNLDGECNLSNDRNGDVTDEWANDGWCELRNHMWQKDLYTASLPWAQRGSEVLMPLAGSGSVSYYDTSLVFSSDGSTPGQTNIMTQGPGTSGGAPLGRRSTAGPPWIADDQVRIENIDSVDITASSVSINDLRRSLALQRWLENNARGGYRYIEQIESHFNTRVPDYRLQRAEYLGGGKQPITISEVLSTTDTASVPVGDMAGHGVSVGKTNRFSYKCQEHGWIIGIVTVTPQTAYQQGIDRKFLRADKFDFGWPELAHIGEQETLSKELFYSFNQADVAANDAVFGYIPRYSEYKFHNDRVSGDFRDDLSFWHLGRIFTSRPSLNSAFTTMIEDGGIEESYRRIFAVQDGTDYLWFQMFHRIGAKRPLPYFGVPKIS